MTEQATREQRSKRRRQDARAYQLLLFMTFPIFLVGAAGKIALGHGVAGRSVFKEAKVDAATTIALAFMG